MQLRPLAPVPVPAAPAAARPPLAARLLPSAALRQRPLPAPSTRKRGTVWLTPEPLQLWHPVHADRSPQISHQKLCQALAASRGIAVGRGGEARLQTRIKRLLVSSARCSLQPAFGSTGACVQGILQGAQCIPHAQVPCILLQRAQLRSVAGRVGSMNLGSQLRLPRLHMGLGGGDGVAQPESRSLHPATAC